MDRKTDFLFSTGKDFDQNFYQSVKNQYYQLADKIPDFNFSIPKMTNNFCQLLVLQFEERRKIFENNYLIIS